MKLQPELLRRYDRPGPRYTSYPTAVEFHDGVRDATMRERLRTLGASGRPAGLYVHMPFCEARCLYCACNVVISPLKERVVGPYLRALHDEVNMIADELGRPVEITQFHIGGGTPTYHKPEDLAAVVDHIASRFTIAADAERSIEVDPRVTTRRHLEVLAERGFRRISVGLQDTDPTVQEAIGRVQTMEQTRRVVEDARELGFTSLNIDLIYGLPYQTPETMAQTVADAVALGADRLAVYSFAWVPSQRGHQRKMPTEALPDADAKLELLSTLHASFEEAGYVSIGIDHFARPDDELAVAQREGRLGRTFMGYTTVRADDWIGAGVSAIGFVDGAYVQNSRKLSEYQRMVADGAFPVVRGVELEADDEVRAHVIRELMCNFRVDKADVERRFGVGFDDYFADDLASLRPYVDDGIVHVEGGQVEARGVGRAFVRNLALCFDAYRRAGATHRFSRTI